jgi:hypothetical protein
MLELGDAKLQLVQIVAGDEVQLLDEGAQERHRLLAGPCARPADTGRKFPEEFLDHIGDAVATGHGRADASGGAGGASRGAPARPAPTATR